MSDELRELDAEIARRRGWTCDLVAAVTGSHWCWRSPDGTPEAAPPPFSSDWAWAGVLLEEMVRRFGWQEAQRQIEQHLAVAVLMTTSIARAWIAAHGAPPAPGPPDGR